MARTTSPCVGAADRRPGHRARAAAPPPGRCASSSLEREPTASAAHQTGAQLRRHPRRHLLRAGLAEGAAVRRGRARAVRLLRRARHRRYERCGKVIVALDAARAAGASTSSRRRGPRQRRARACGALGPEELAEVEPHAAGVAALHSPADGHRRLRRRRRARSPSDVGARGGELRLRLRASRGVDAARGDVLLRHAAGEPRRRRRALFCAGAWASALAVAARRAGRPAHRPLPRRLPAAARRPRATSCAGSIYPVPDPALPFLGVHLTRASTARCCSGRPRCWSARATPTPCAPCGARPRDTLAWPGPGA